MRSRPAWPLLASSAPLWGDRLEWTELTVLACLREHRVIAVDAVAVRVVARIAARLSIYRPEGGAVFAWELTRPPSTKDR